MSAPTVAVLALGTGNVRSVVRAVRAAGGRAEATADYTTAAHADGLVIPGQGSFPSVMAALDTIHGARLIERRLAGGRPVLGICVGLQIMFDSSQEGDATGETAAGLSQWPGVVHQLPAPVTPHMGWTRVSAAADSYLLPAGEHYFYFAHSFAVLTDPAQAFIEGPTEPPAVSFAEYGTRFVAAVENGPLSAVQFHPEKSGEAGHRFFQRWVARLAH